MPEKLTPEVLFAGTSLAGSIPQQLRLTPDNGYVTYRAAAPDDRFRMDLHRVNLSTGESELWIDARTIETTSSDVTELTAEERAERERRRDFSHGVTSYSWRPAANELLVPLNGQAFIGHPEADWRSVTPAGTRQSAFQFSPDGNYLSYVRERNLYVLDLSGDEQEVAVTAEEDAHITCGLPDFLAAEEMHRFEGYWWGNNSECLYFTRVDDSTVEVSYRLEVDANGANTVAQRYPYAGAANPAVELFRWDFKTKHAQCIWRSNEETGDAYLARVYPVDDGVVLLTQNRRQNKLDYRFCHEDASNPETFFTEDSTTWVNLTDDFLSIGGHRYLVTHEQSGTRQMLIIDRDGTTQELPQITHINRVVKRTGDVVWVNGWHDTPIENHLFKIDLNSGDVQRLTEAPGWHETTVGDTVWLDQFSASQTPTEVHIHPFSTAPDRSSSRQIFSNTIDASHPYAPYLAAHSYSEFGVCEATDGTELHYRLTPPSDVSGEHPVILYVYGGPGAQKVRNEWSPLLVQLFAHQGYGVLEVDNRGSTNRGRAFEAPLYRAMGGVEVEDQISGLAALNSRPWADVNRVGVFGHSYGGYMTLMCLCQSQAFKAGVAVAPVCDWGLYDSHYTERFMDLPELNPSGYEQSNVLTHLDKLSSPLLLMHGMADDNVLFTNTTMIMDALQRMAKPFELMTYPGAKHSMQEPHVSIHRFNAILTFFNKHLK